MPTPEPLELKLPDMIGQGVATYIPGPLSDEDERQLRARAKYYNRPEEDWRQDVETLLGQIDRYKYLASQKQA